MARVYHFDLPYKILGVYLPYGRRQLQLSGAWRKIPEFLRHKWERAEELEHDLRVSQSDLDSIDNETWAYIARKLDLKWDHA